MAHFSQGGEAVLQCALVSPGPSCIHHVKMQQNKVTRTPYHAGSNDGKPLVSLLKTQYHGKYNAIAVAKFRKQ